MLSAADLSVPKQWRDWLADTGSLTSRLIDVSAGDFRVQIISQGLQLPRLSEITALSLAPRRLALIREVVLYGKGQPWVYARSVIPLATLTGRLKKLRHLDNRPLGALLFNDVTMRRDPVEIACISSDNAQFPQVLREENTPVWGRRSVFRIDQKPLLVSEIFLSAFKSYNQTLDIGFTR
ncbi:MAG: chorismate lyase [Porticoccaceae bacterium]|jgi:chorismate--pyruvate lyase|nr:chorismate lyase [Porticoccaceae bacterium]MDG1307850.1 chorismate lyase [Porticoccaceae bacterium]